MGVPGPHLLSRRAILRVGGSAVLGAAMTAVLPGAGQGAPRRRAAAISASASGALDADALFRALDAQIEAAMAAHQIPGVAMGVFYDGHEYVRGYGVTNDEIVGYNVAASHRIEDDQPVVQPALWRVWRTLNPTGGLIASARDLLRYVRFHLSDGVTTDPPVLSPATLRAMRTDLGPGGTMEDELDGVGVTWFQRSTAEGVPVYEHTGDWPGQAAGALFVPARGFALTVLTNATSGMQLRDELLFADNGPLHQFTGLRYPPAVPRVRTAAQLAPYEGRYWAQVMAPPPGDAAETWFEFTAGDGWLEGRMRAGEVAQGFELGFYRDNYARILDSSGEPVILRADFVPGPDGRIAWFRFGGRLHARQG